MYEGDGVHDEGYEEKDDAQRKQFLHVMRAGAGFRVRVTSGEMRRHLEERASWHRAKAAELAKRAEKAREDFAKVEGQSLTRKIADAVKDTLGMPESEAQAAVANMLPQAIDRVTSGTEEASRVHAKAANAFQFYASHLAESHYDLSIQESAMLEFVGVTLMGAMGAITAQGPE